MRESRGTELLTTPDTDEEPERERAAVAAVSPDVDALDMMAVTVAVAAVASLSLLLAWPAEDNRLVLGGAVPEADVLTVVAEEVVTG